MVLEAALTRCPRCLATLDGTGSDDLPYLECSACGDAWL